MTATRRFLGIDPGIAITGFAVIEVGGGEQRIVEYGVITTKKELSLPERLVELQRDLQQLLERHENIAAVGVEELFFSKNAKTAFMVGQARGVILFTLSSRGITIEELTPGEVKQAITGSGSAQKIDVQRTIQLLFSLPTLPQPDDAADAIAIASTIAARYRLNHYPSH